MFYLFESLFNFQDSTIVDWLTLIVLTLTFITLCIYAVDTKKITNATLAHNKMYYSQFMPVLIHSIKKDGDSRLRFHIKNIGGGPAKNISLSDFCLDCEKNITGKMHKNIAYIKPGEEVLSDVGYKDAGIIVDNPDDISDYNGMLEIDKVPFRIHGNVTLIFEFENCNEIKYRQKNKIRKTNHLLGFPESI